MKLLYFILIMLVVVYPNKLLEGTYINFLIIYVIYFIQLLFANKQKDKELITYKNYSTWFLMAIFIVVLMGCLISLIYVSYTGISGIQILEYTKAIFRHLSYVLLFAILCNATRTRKDFNFIIVVCLITYTISLILIVIDSFKVEFIDEIFKPKSALWLPETHFRAFGAYLTPISAGIFIMGALTIIFTYLLEKKDISQKTKIILYLIIGLSLFCLLASASRTGMFGVLVLILLVLYRSDKRISFTILFALLLIIIVQTGFLDTHIDNIIRRNTEQSASSNILEGSGRYETFQQSLNLSLGFRTLFFGVGLPEYVTGDGEFAFAHNGILSIVLCFGLVGLIVFLRYGWQLIKEERNTNFNYLLVKRFLIVTLISFISSDGPVTHYWYIFLIFFIYYITYNNVDSQQELR